MSCVCRHTLWTHPQVVLKYLEILERPIWEICTRKKDYRKFSMHTNNWLLKRTLSKIQNSLHDKWFLLCHFLIHHENLRQECNWIVIVFDIFAVAFNIQGRKCLFCSKEDIANISEWALHVFSNPFNKQLS